MPGQRSALSSYPQAPSYPQALEISVESPRVATNRIDTSGEEAGGPGARRGRLPAHNFITPFGAGIGPDVLATPTGFHQVRQVQIIHRSVR